MTLRHATTAEAARHLATPGHCSYLYVAHPDWTRASVPADAVVAYEPLNNHDDKCNFLFADGTDEPIHQPRAGKLVAAASATTRPVSAAAVP
jgi:prepilin-type processing-associated H-X9-DG protein